MLKATAGGGGRDAAGGEPGAARGGLRRRRGRGGRGIRRRLAVPREGASRPPGTSRCRCSATPRAACSRSASGSARSSAATRSSSRSHRRAAITPETREELEASVARACRAVGYLGAGTFEFLLGPDGAPYFIEVNCRLQVEHPVTELVTGIDLVREQLRIAAGERLDSHRARANARATRSRSGSTPRTPPRGFAPAPGVVRALPAAPRARRRVDTAIEDGLEIPPYYDSLIAKVIVWDDDRPAAIARAIRALEELEVDGIPTTRELALDVLRSEGFAAGEYSTGYLDEMERHLPSLRLA